MFGYEGLFNFFSRYTFHSLSRYNSSPSSEYRSPGLTDRDSPDGIEDQASARTGAVQPVGELEAPVDSIELSNNNLSPFMVSSKTPILYARCPFTNVWVTLE